MKIYLAIMFLINGQWVDGATIDGWAPREQPSMEICLDRARQAMTAPPPRQVEWLQASCQLASARLVSRMGTTAAGLHQPARFRID